MESLCSTIHELHREVEVLENSTIDEATFEDLVKETHGTTFDCLIDLNACKDRLHTLLESIEETKSLIFGL